MCGGLGFSIAGLGLTTHRRVNAPLPQIRNMYHMHNTGLWRGVCNACGAQRIAEYTGKAIRSTLPASRGDHPFCSHALKCRTILLSVCSLNPTFYMPCTLWPHGHTLTPMHPDGKTQSVHVVDWVLSPPSNSLY